MPSRTSPGLSEERAARKLGFRAVAGVDEAGRGAWAGPVSAAAVIFPDARDIARRLAGVNDSKQLDMERRLVLRAVIERNALSWCVGMASNDEIDALGIVPATRLAMTRAIAGLAVSADFLLIDAVKLPALSLPQRSFNFADSISLSVAAASILAKTTRDAVMSALDDAMLGYQFGAHKGYGTAAHQQALRAHGVSRFHRRSYKPIASLTQ